MWHNGWPPCSERDVAFVPVCSFDVDVEDFLTRLVDQIASPLRCPTCRNMWLGFKKNHKVGRIVVGPEAVRRRAPVDPLERRRGAGRTRHSGRRLRLLVSWVRRNHRANELANEVRWYYRVLSWEFAVCMCSHQVRCAEFGVGVHEISGLLRFSLRQSKTRINTEQASTMTTSPQCHMTPVSPHQTRFRSYTDVTGCVGCAVRPNVAVISSHTHLFSCSATASWISCASFVVCVCVRVSM